MQFAYYFVVTAVIHDALAYRAAVVDFNPSRNPSITISRVTRDNALLYEKHIKAASEQKAQIIVLPEYGLSTVEMIGKVKEHLEDVGMILNEGSTPCDSSTDTVLSESLKIISCAARTYSIYVVMNSYERVVYDVDAENTENDLYYSTTIVLDRRGTIVSKYRAINRNKDDVNLSTGTSAVKFTTDFGVSFGMLTSDDLLSTNPSINVLKDNVTDVILCSCRKSISPFFTALSLQQGYSIAHGVNLLAASYKDDDVLGGSGVYTKSGDELHYGDNDASELIVSDVDSKTNHAPAETNPNIPKKLSKENFTLYETSVLELDGEDKSRTICSGEFCCDFEYNGHGESTVYTYMMVIYSDVGSTLANNLTTCGIVACLNSSKTTCGNYVVDNTYGVEFTELKILLKIGKNDNELYVPTTLTNTFYPFTRDDYSVERTDWGLQIKITKSVRKILAFGIIAKNIIQLESNSLGTGMIILIILILIIIIILVAVLVYKRGHLSIYKRAPSS